MCAKYEDAISGEKCSLFNKCILKRKNSGVIYLQKLLLVQIKLKVKLFTELFGNVHAWNDFFPAKKYIYAKTNFAQSCEIYSGHFFLRFIVDFSFCQKAACFTMYKIANIKKVKVFTEMLFRQLRFSQPRTTC